MALVAGRNSVGFEPIYNKTVTDIPNPVAYELTPSTAFNKGDMVVLTGGKLALATATSVGDIVGVMAESVTSDATSVIYGKVYDHPDNVYRCTFASQVDSIATGGSTTTLVDSGITLAANGAWVGALLYIYAGTNAGCIRTISASAASGNVLTVSAPFPAACDATSKYIILGNGPAATGVINVGASGIVLKDKKTIDASAASLDSGAKVGPLVCVGASKVTELMLDVMIRRGAHAFA